MTLDRKALESALLTHGPLSWDEHDIGIYADEALDADADTPESMAHIFWTMGANKEHDGCPYAPDGDGSDGDYSNRCAECEEYLTELSRKVLAEANRG
jgi:hypothetical protein